MGKVDDKRGEFSLARVRMREMGILLKCEELKLLQPSWMGNLEI